MHHVIREAISKIVDGLPNPVKVLEVGATRSDNLLTLPKFSEAQCVGINPDPEQLGWGGWGDKALPIWPGHKGWSIQLGTGHDLPWPDGYFDLVLCNSVLEHDPAFWKTLAEMKRVLKGHIVIGVPAFVEQSRSVLQVHRYPKDYYRFGEDAVREVFFEGLNLRGLEELMLNYSPTAPRILAWGDNL